MQFIHIPFFHDTSGFNLFTVIFFIILILFLPLGLSMFSDVVVDKMEYKRKKENNYKYHRTLFICIGIVGIFCLQWKLNKVNTILNQSNTFILQGYFGNEIAQIKFE